MYGIHPVREALANPDRHKSRLVITRNAMNRLGSSVAESGLDPEIVAPRDFPIKFDAETAHQGCALLVNQLPFGTLDECLLDQVTKQPRLAIFLDQVTDPMNTGAILRTAGVFGACAVVAPTRHSAPESGALAKAASGALDVVPYVRVSNLANSLIEASDAGWTIIGLDGSADEGLGEGLTDLDPEASVAVVFGSEGKGLRKRTIDCCHFLSRIGKGGVTGSLNVSTSVAVTLYAVRTRQGLPF